MGMNERDVVLMAKDTVVSLVVAHPYLQRPRQLLTLKTKLGLEGKHMSTL